MKKWLFGKVFIFIITIITIIVIVIKFYNLFSFPVLADGNYKQLKKIDKGKSEFTIAVFGDNKNSHKVFENLIDSVNNDPEIDFCIDLGDLVYDGEREKYNYFLNQVKRLNVPYLTAVGNHDIKEDGRAVYYNLYGPYYYSFNIGDAYFIILDDASEVELEQSQMAWLKSELKVSQKFKYKFVMFHVPLYDPREKIPPAPLFTIPIFKEYEFHHSLENKKQAGELIKLFENYNITHIYASHIHAYYTGKWGNIPFTITGGAGAELIGNDPQHDYYHYIKLEITPASYTETIVKLPTPDFEIFDRITHDLWIYIYAFFVIHFWDIILVLTLIYLGYYFIFIKYKILTYNKRNR